MRYDIQMLNNEILERLIRKDVVFARALLGERVSSTKNIKLLFSTASNNYRYREHTGKYDTQTICFEISLANSKHNKKWYVDDFGVYNPKMCKDDVYRLELQKNETRAMRRAMLREFGVAYLDTFDAYNNSIAWDMFENKNREVGIIYNNVNKFHNQVIDLAMQQNIDYSSIRNHN